MVRFAKTIFCLTLLALGVQRAPAFALFGPFNEDYQVQVIFYQLPGDIGGPKNIGEEYRRNTPVLYWTFDQNFYDYFGSNGVVAVEQAFAVMNGLTNVSAYSGDLSEFPYESQSYNYQAQALELLDLKSIMMNILMEQMGLAEPQRYVWTLHDRLVGPTPGCPLVVTYTVIKRNFDPAFSTTDQLQPSSYVNGTLFTYQILDICTGSPWLADAVEFAVDPLARQFTAIAELQTGPDLGGFFTGLTRDDVGGIRYLLRTNNMNIENAGADTITFLTNNPAQHQLLVSSNLTALAAAALTNDAPALQALYPTLAIASTTYFFTNAVTTNVFAYFTNLPWSPIGAPASVAFVTNRTTNVTTYFSHTFANVITNTYYTSGRTLLLVTNISAGACNPLSPPGSICTNVTATPVTTSMVMGDFFIIPTNGCGFSIIATQFVNVLSSTNVVFVATNAPGTTNVANEFFSQSVVNFFTNYYLDVRLVTCPSNTVALRQGIDRVSFVRRDFDSLFNRFFYPITNQYTLNAVTNNQVYPQRTWRIVTAPDFLITADDLATDPGDPAIGAAVGTRNIQFNQNNINPAIAGPGTIEPTTTFTLDKVGPIYINPGLFSFFVVPPFSEATHSQFLLFGSFDGSTNAPIVYPNGTDITNIENQVLIQVSPPGPALPDGTVGSNYTNVFSGFTATGGQPPYFWSPAPGSPALPPPLTLNPDGTISGVPQAASANLTYDFVVRLTDSGSRFVDRGYSVKINSP